MIYFSKTKKTVLIIFAVFICLFIFLYIFKKADTASEREQPNNSIVSSQSSAGSSEDYSSANTDEGSRMLPDENDEVFFEQIEGLEYLPWSIYFRKFTFVLKDCWYSKKLCGQPEMIYKGGFDDLKIDDDGTILSDHTYLHVTFSLKNETDQEIVRYLNTSRLYIENLQEHYTESMAEMAVMNLPSQQEDARYYYKWAFAPYEETEFTVTFLLRDQYLGDDYSIHFFYSPEGRTDVKEVNGQEVMISDAKYILLDHVLRAEGEERTKIPETDPSSSDLPSMSSQNSETSTPVDGESSAQNDDEIIFWQPGEEEAEIVTEMQETGEITYVEFYKPVYLRDYKQLRELAQLYDLEKYTTFLEFCSPFDGSDPKYIKIPGGGYMSANSYFSIPGKDDVDLIICQGWLENDTDRTDESLLEHYAWYENNPDQRIRESAKLYQGDPPVVSYHLDHRYGGDYDGYLLEWVYNGILLQITDLPEKAIIDDPELLETLVEYIQKGRYIKNGSESSE